MKQRKYRFKHISDLAKLEPEDIGAFAEELPNLIAELKNMEQTAKVLRTELSSILPHIDWENDGKNEVEIELKISKTN